MTINAITAALSEREVRDEALKADFQGELIRPGDPVYEEARQIWNGMIDRHPALIARCAGVADVMAAVRYGRERDLLVAIRGGGHNVAGTAVCDGGLVIDLSGMKGIRVDPVERTVRAEPPRRQTGRAACRPGRRRRWTRRRSRPSGRDTAAPVPRGMRGRA